MVHDRVGALVAAIADGVTAAVEQLHGLTQREIDEIEHGGGGAGHFLQGSDVFHPLVLGLGQAARELLEDNRVPFTWTPEDRVIPMHQGYQFDVLRGRGPDPEVWSYSEGAPVMSYSCFTDWLQAQVRQQTRAWAHLVPWYEGEKAKPAGGTACVLRPGEPGRQHHRRLVGRCSEPFVDGHDVESTATTWRIARNRRRAWPTPRGQQRLTRRPVGVGRSPTRRRLGRTVGSRPGNRL